MPPSPFAALGAAIFACLLAAGPASAAAAPFSAAPDIAIADGTPQAVAAGDFNSDGRQDLAITDERRRRVSIRLGNGDGTFRDGGPVGADLFRPYDVAVADLDADGIEDLAVAAAQGDRELEVFRGVGDGTFFPTAALNLPTRAESLAIGDFNGDGAADLAATNLLSVSVRLGTGNGAFAATGPDIDTGRYTGGIQAADLDGDGREDLTFIMAGTPQQLGVLTGKGDGTFHAVRTAAVPNLVLDTAVGDFDGDAIADVAAPVTFEDRIAVRAGKGDGSLGDGPPDVPTGDRPIAVVAADLDGDGAQDVATANTDDDSVSVRLGNGDGTFRDGGEIEVGDFPVALAAGDFDADGREDLAVANLAGATVSIRLGAGTAPLEGNLLVNGGFEDGFGARLPGQSAQIPGWKRTGGMTAVRYGSFPHFGVPTHLDAPRWGGGLNLLGGGDGAATGGITTATQTADVSASAEAIDGGRATAKLSALLGGGVTYGDRMGVHAAFLDGEGAERGALDLPPLTAADRRNRTILVPREGRAPVPPGTRSIRVTLTSFDDDKTFSSAIADDVKLTLALGPPAAKPGAGPADVPATGEPATSGDGAAGPGPVLAFGASAKVSLRLAGARPGRDGRVAVRLVNDNAFGITGTLQAKAGRAAVHRRLAIGANRSVVVKLALPRALRRKLAARHRLDLRLRAVLRDPAGGARQVSAKVRVRSR
ncbi:MAG: VCBS repeat-containing protein [Solirubrobacterales bacterium]|nr:VCBS repeat-containing protein [Solirubrobacterales bacterium]